MVAIDDNHPQPVERLRDAIGAQKLHKFLPIVRAHWSVEQDLVEQDPSKRVRCGGGGEKQETGKPGVHDVLPTYPVSTTAEYKPSGN